MTMGVSKMFFGYLYLQTGQIKIIKILFLLFISETSVFAQTLNKVGQLQFENCKMENVENVTDTISGLPVKMIRVIVNSRTRVQTSCNFGDPSDNKYDTVNNK